MAISKLTEDVSIHQTLDDEPNDVGGLTAAELKAAWDAPAGIIKNYLNDSLIPELDAAHLPYAYGTEDGQTIKQAVEEATLGTVPDGSVGTVKLTDGAVTAEKLAASAIATQEQAADGTDNKKLMTPLLVKQAVTSIAPWRLIRSYTAAGTYIWTAPDLYRDGRPYEIGVWMIGGGGSGSVCSAAEAGYYFSGGGSGYVKAKVFAVTPGNNYTAVIGAGGGAATATNSSREGYNGNTTSFHGASADGGAKGTVTSSSTNYGADGGQGSTAPRMLRAKEATKTPYGCEVQRQGVESGDLGGISQSALEAINPFAPVEAYVPAAGGSLCIATIQAQSTLPSGNTTSVSVYSSSASAAVKSNEPGAGGGCAFVKNTSYSATSAAGADGAVLIYARGYEA